MRCHNLKRNPILIFTLDGKNCLLKSPYFYDYYFCNWKNFHHEFNCILIKELLNSQKLKKKIRGLFYSIIAEILISITRIHKHICTYFFHFSKCRTAAFIFFITNQNLLISPAAGNEFCFIRIPLIRSTPVKLLILNFSKVFPNFKFC